MRGSAPRGIKTAAVTGMPRHNMILAAEVLHGADASRRRSFLSGENLASLQPGALLFQTPQILSIWARHFARAPPRLISRRLLSGMRGGPVLIWPLFVERHGLLRIACGAGAPISQYDDILVDPQACDQNRHDEHGAGRSGKMVRPDLVMFERVRADSMLRAALRDASPLGCDEGAPYLDLSRRLGAALRREIPYAPSSRRSA